MAYRKPYYNEDHKLVRYGIRDFLSDAADFFVRFFRWTNIRHAFRSVLSGFGEYAVFFAALLLLQTFFWLPWLGFDLYAAEAGAQAAECDYNLLLEGYTEREWANLYNAVFVMTDKEGPNERGYISYDVSHYYGKPGEVLVRLRFLLCDDSEKACLGFLRRYALGGENVTCNFGERTMVGERIDTQQSDTRRTCFFTGVLSVLIVAVLFMIRTNQFKFRYGIYMSFGADFEKLVETGSWEMLAIAILTALPSLGLSLLLLLLVTGKAVLTGILSHLPALLLWLLCVIFIGVMPGVKILSVAAPVSMIAARDNSNFAASPRRSFRIFGKTFPFHYELYGMLRFRRYYGMLLAFAVAFTTLYSSGLFVADLRRTEDGMRHPQFVLTSDFDEFDTDLIDEIGDYAGVSCLNWGESLSATAISSHVILTEQQVSAYMSGTVEYGEGIADNRFRYFPLSERLREEIEKNGLWKTEGDLAAVSSGTSYVAVTCSVNNQKLLNFKVGDTLRLARLESRVPIDETRPDKKQMLKRQTELGDFGYYEVTVAAIVDDGYTGDEYGIILSDELYAEITHRQAAVRRLEVYLEDSVGIPREEELRGLICEAVSGLTGARVTDRGEIYERRLSLICRTAEVLVLASFLLLLISPLVWFYSQMMFGRKREKEMTLISALGGTDRDLSRLILSSGGMLALAATAATGLLTTLLTYLVYYFMNVFLPSLGFGEGVRYSYRLSVGGFFVCLAVTTVSAVLSTYLPFLFWKRERDRVLACGRESDDERK